MADIELVIKIDEEDYKIMKHNIAVNNPLCPLSQEEMVSKVADGTPLPKNATNGDVICALWNVSVVYEKGCYRIIRGGERWSSILKFSEEWWNAPYRKE